MRVLRSALLVTACTREPAARPELARPEPAASEPVVTSRRAPVRSCPATRKPADIRFTPRLHVGLAGGVTWLYGSVDRDGVLAHLGPTGELVLTRAPLADADVAAVEGPRIWLYTMGKINPVIPGQWTAIDVSDPEAPVTGPVLPLQLQVERDYPRMLAVGSRRALLLTGKSSAPELVVLDTATRAAVAPATSAGEDFEPALASCDDDRCALVAVNWEGPLARREQHLVVLRAGPDGRIEREHLGPEGALEAQAVFVDAGIVVAWRSLDGLRLRALDRRGRVVGPIVAPPPGPEYTRHALFVTDGAPMLAVMAGDRWSVASVGPDAALGALRELPGADKYWLFGAPLDDGLAWAGIQEDVHYSDGFHAWQSHVIAGFLPPTGAPPGPPVTIGSGSGDGRGGFQVHMLARPGAAAAVLDPHGADFTGEARRQVVPLRTPCDPQ